MTADAPRPTEPASADPTSGSDSAPTGAGGPPATRPTAASGPTAPQSQGLFRTRPDAIGPAPIYFSVALGITFGASLGLLLDQLIIGIIFGALLGALYGAIRRANHRG